jgi:hypothetical protein
MFLLNPLNILILPPEFIKLVVKLPFLMMRFLKNNRFLIFLILLLSLFIVVSFIGNPVHSSLIETVNYSLLLLSGLYAFSDVRNFFRFTVIFFITAIVIDWIQYINPQGELINTLRALLTAPVLALLLIMTLKSIRTATQVSKDVIYAALSGYILIGYIGGFLIIAISLLYPGSYNITGRIDFLEALYFSFVTMTTLGYGEILPLTDEARALTILLSILGPMYVAILIAMIVGKYASITEREKNE